MASLTTHAVDSAREPPFWLVPRWILRDPAISNTVLALWLAGSLLVVKQSRKDAPPGRARFQVSRRDWAARANVSKRTVDSVVAGELPLITIIDRAEGLYEIEAVGPLLKLANSRGGWKKVWVPPVPLKPGPMRLWCALHWFVKTDAAQETLAEWIGVKPRLRPLPGGKELDAEKREKRESEAKTLRVRRSTLALQKAGLIEVRRGQHRLTITKTWKPGSGAKMSEQKRAKVSDHRAKMSDQRGKNVRQLRLNL